VPVQAHGSAGDDADNFFSGETVDDVGSYKVFWARRKCVSSRNVRGAQRNEKEGQGNVGGERYLARHRTVTTSKQTCSPLRGSGREYAIACLVAKRGK
jgi:hypothetical protein